MTRSLSPHSSLVVLRADAKRWLKAITSGDLEALARFRSWLPDHTGTPKLREVQQALDVERHLAAQIALDLELHLLDHLADAPALVVIRMILLLDITSQPKLASEVSLARGIVPA